MQRIPPIHTNRGGYGASPVNRHVAAAPEVKHDTAAVDGAGHEGAVTKRLCRVKGEVLDGVLRIQSYLGLVPQQLIAKVGQPQAAKTIGRSVGDRVEDCVQRVATVACIASRVVGRWAASDQNNRPVR